jgi:hypothetical protein
VSKSVPSRATSAPAVAHRTAGPHPSRLHRAPRS